MAETSLVPAEVGDVDNRTLPESDYSKKEKATSAKRTSAYRAECESHVELTSGWDFSRKEKVPTEKKRRAEYRIECESTTEALSGWKNRGQGEVGGRAVRVCRPACLS